MQVRNLKPEIVWNHFEDLNNVPRPSKKEERVILTDKMRLEKNEVDHISRTNNS